jgi:hypothetical protein
MIGDELINFRHEVFVAIDARKRARFNARVIRQIIDEMCSTFVDNSLHTQLPSGEINVLDLKVI